MNIDLIEKLFNIIKLFLSFLVFLLSLKNGPIYTDGLNGLNGLVYKIATSLLDG